MDDLPPTYEAAVDRDVWKLVTSWVASSDLCSACLVSQKWHSLFAPRLWGDPASHFTTRNDAVFVALSQFRRTLHRARLSVRRLTHTIRLHPNAPEIYSEPHIAWLRCLLEHLPNLQTLIVSGCAFVDHRSLLALGQKSELGEQGDPPVSNKPLYDLKLLVAAKAPNATSSGLTEALSRLRKLVYLDLSHNMAARKSSVLSVLHDLQDIQVLKLRNTGMDDHGVQILASSIRTRARLLDLRQNTLTDETAETLREQCILPSLNIERNRMGDSDSAGSRTIDDTWRPDSLGLRVLRSQSLDKDFLRHFSQPLTGRLALDHVPHVGLTHLYISDNYLGARGVFILLRLQKLHVLDVGNLHKFREDPDAQDFLSSLSSLYEMSQVRKEQDLLPWAFQNRAGRDLTYLRIHHSVVTELCEDKIVKPFHPGHLPHLQTLVLTNFPTHVSASSNLVPSFLSFIRLCAHSAHSAFQQARFTYDLPPGRERSAAEVQHARSLFGLSTVILEMEETRGMVADGRRCCQQQKHNAVTRRRFKSSTEDVDSEALWAAAENDFSFFNGNDDAETDIAAVDRAEVQARRSTASLKDMSDAYQVCPPSSKDVSPAAHEHKTGYTSNIPTVDVIAEISDFRKQRRKAWMEVNEAALAASDIGSKTADDSLGGKKGQLPKQKTRKEEPERAIRRTPGHTRSSVVDLVEGYWDGEIKVVR